MDPLDRLIEMARHASPVDRLRLERTIAIILRTRLAVMLTHQAQQRAQSRLTRAKAASPQIREDGAGHLAGLRIMEEDIPR